MTTENSGEVMCVCGHVQREHSVIPSPLPSIPDQGWVCHVCWRDHLDGVGGDGYAHHFKPAPENSEGSVPRVDDPEMEPGPPCGICGDPEWEPLTPWRPNGHEGDHEFVSVEVANRIRASERAAVLAEVEEAMSERLDRSDDMRICGWIIGDVIARIRNGGAA